ncbi:MAG: hypothetical protein P4M08_01045 [Oligoflexia bacterium]|nr:hypothetical protein [Oligoflexia bacterium]
MKNTYRSMIVSLIALTFSASFGALAWSQENEGPGQGPHGMHHHHEFMMGVCVGQKLAQQGVTLPVPQPGQKPSLTDAQKAALKSASQACRAQFKPNEPAPSASATPSS